MANQSVGAALAVVDEAGLLAEGEEDVSQRGVVELQRDGRVHLRLGRVRADIEAREAATLLLAVLFALGTMPATGGEALSPERVASAVQLLVRGFGTT